MQSSWLKVTTRPICHVQDCSLIFKDGFAPEMKVNLFSLKEFLQTKHAQNMGKYAQYMGKSIRYNGLQGGGEQMRANKIQRN